MNLTPFRCLIRFDKDLALAVQCRTGPNNTVILHVNLYRMDALSNLVFITQYQAENVLKLSDTPEALRDAAIEFLEFWYAHGHLGTLSNSRYFKLKHDLFYLLSLAEAEKQNDPNSDIIIYYKAVPDRTSPDAIYLVGMKNIYKFIQNGVF